nr:MAK10-like protein [Tanacetum cinerariifolium]GEY42248.1 MAK10-like protein [Tanacetum cinerariifolium]
MGDENPIRTLGDYSKPSHEGYRNTIKLPVGNNVNDPRDFTKPVKAIAFPQDVLSTSDRRLIKLENQVQRLMEAHLALTQPTQVNKIPTSCEICSGPHDTHYCMEDPEQAFVEYATSRTDEAGGKRYTFKPEQNNLGDTYNPSWRSHPNLRGRQTQNSQNNFSNPPSRLQLNGSIPNRTFFNNPQSFNNQSNLEGLVSNFMASQDARLSKFEADFKQQQSKMTNKIDAMLKAITDRMAGTLPSDIVKNPKLSTYLVLSNRSYTNEDPQCSTQTHDSINAITIHTKQQSALVPSSSNTELVCIKEEDGDVMFIEIVPKDDKHESKKRKLDSMENANGGVSNLTRRIKGMHVFVGNFTYVIDFMIIKDISSIIHPRLSQVVLGKPFVEISNMTHDPPEGVVRFTNKNNEVAYKMPHKIEQYYSLSNVEKEHTKSVFLRNEEDTRRGVEYVMSKILRFYKECQELGLEYLSGMDDEGEVT